MNDEKGPKGTPVGDSRETLANETVDRDPPPPPPDK